MLHGQWVLLYSKLRERWIHLLEFLYQPDPVCENVWTFRYCLGLAPAPPRKTRGELMKNIDADYYGYRDEDDGVLVPLERQAEKEGEAIYVSYKN